MAEEIKNQNSFTSAVGGALFGQALFTAPVAIKSVAREKSIKGAVEALEIKKFKELNAQLKTTTSDVFSRSTILTDNYETYRKLYKESVDLGKKATKLEAKATKKGTQEALEAAQKAKTAATEAADKFADAKKALSAGKQVTQTVTVAGLKDTAKSLAKKELTSKFNIGLSVLTTFVPAFVGKVMPAFKEQGVGAGLKELGKATLQTATDFVAYGIGGAIGRTLGMVVGTAICPGAGTVIGGGLGDAIGSIFIGGKVTNVTNKIIGVEDETQEQQPSQASSMQFNA